MNSIGPAIVRVAPTLIAILTLTATDRCAAGTPPPVPIEFQDVYNTLNTDLSAFNTSGNISALSGTISVTTLPLPSPPPNVAATAASKTQVNVTWGPAHTGMPLASYHVFRGASSASLAQLKVVNGTQTSCIDYPVTAGTTYYYAVQTADTGGNLSALSPAVSVTTPK